MPYIEVAELDDARLDVYARLTEAQLRNKLEPEKGIFIAESVKVIDRALAGGMVPVSLLITPQWRNSPDVESIVERAEAAYERASRNDAEGAAGQGGGEGPCTAEAVGTERGAALGDGGEASGVRACEAAEFPVFVLPQEQAQRLTGFNLTRGILCAMRRPKLPTVEELLARVDADKAAKAEAVRKAEEAGVRDEGEIGNISDASRRRIAVLEGIVDHTNVGAIFRSAAALGVDAVLVTPTCCDPLYRRSVRVSMGTVFQVPWTRIGESVRDWPAAGLERLKALGYKTAAMALSDDSVPLGAPELAACDKLALVFGTEGDGLSSRTIEGTDYTVRIPMREGVDSLNVAAASAVTFWELCE